MSALKFRGSLRCVHRKSCAEKQTDVYRGEKNSYPFSCGELFDVRLATGRYYI